MMKRASDGSFAAAAPGLIQCLYLPYGLPRQAVLSFLLLNFDMLL
jgi:hypothetical protein